MDEKRDEKFFIKIENERNDQKLKNKFIEVTQEGKEKFKTYVTEIDTSNCCKIFFSVFKFVLFCILFVGIMFLLVNGLIRCYEYQQNMQISASAIESYVGNLNDKIESDKRVMNGKLDQILKTLSVLESKIDGKYPDVLEDPEPTDQEFLGFVWNILAKNDDGDVSDGSKILNVMK